MSYRKTHDLAVKVGSYAGQDGAEKGRYENVGHIISDGGKEIVLLKRTFNPAGVPNPDGRDTVILSVFEAREQNSRDTPREQPRQQQSGSDWQRNAQTEPLNDDIPF